MTRPEPVAAFPSRETLIAWGLCGCCQCRRLVPERIWLEQEHRCTVHFRRWYNALGNNARRRFDARRRAR